MGFCVKEEKAPTIEVRDEPKQKETKEEIVLVKKEDNRSTEEEETKNKISSILRDVSSRLDFTISDYKTGGDEVRITFSSRNGAVFIIVYGGEMTVQKRGYNIGGVSYTTKDSYLIGLAQRIFESKLQEQMTTYY